jgi:hypothetical protein
VSPTGTGPTSSKDSGLIKLIITFLLFAALMAFVFIGLAMREGKKQDDAATQAAIAATHQLRAPAVTSDSSESVDTAETDSAPAPAIPEEKKAPVDVVEQTPAPGCPPIDPAAVNLNSRAMPERLVEHNVSLPRSSSRIPGDPDVGSYNVVNGVCTVYVMACQKPSACARAFYANGCDPSKERPKECDAPY